MNTDEKLLEKFIRSHSSEVVYKIEELPEQDIAALLEALSDELSALLLGQMDRFIAVRSLEKMPIKKVTHLIEILPFHVAEALLRQIDLTFRDLILEELPKKISNSIRQVLSYPKNSVGSFIDPFVFTLYEDQTVIKGLEKIKNNNPVIGSHIVVLDRNQTLRGFLELKQLVVNDQDILIRSLVKNNLPKILPDMGISEIKDIWENEWIYSQLPVVDSMGIFLGVITKESLAKNDTKKSAYDHHARQTIGALGDLYNIGLSGLFRSAAELVGNQNVK